MDISKVLELIRPGEKWGLSGNSYDGLQWLDSTDKPTYKELEAGHAILAGLVYRDQRRAEYPSIGDQLDALWKLINHGDFSEMPGEVKAVLDKVLDVKCRYPKPFKEI